MLVRFFFLVVFFIGTVSANEYRMMYPVTLKKDEQVTFLVKYATYKREFTLRWTLFVNEGLVLFHTYNKNVFQNILYLNGTNQSFKVLLKPKGADRYEVPYFLVKFNKFDLKKNEAKFEIFLSDKESQMTIKRIKKTIQK